MTSNGGTGARAHADGLSATAYPSGVKGTPVEIAEAITPLIFWKKELRPGSGGAGRTRGGLGQIIEIESGVGEPFELLAAFDRIDFPPRGRNGGSAGAAGVVEIKGGAKMRGKGTQLVRPGERSYFDYDSGVDWRILGNVLGYCLDIPQSTLRPAYSGSHLLKRTSTSSSDKVPFARASSSPRRAFSTT